MDMAHRYLQAVDFRHEYIRVDVAPRVSARHLASLRHRLDIPLKPAYVL